MSSKHDLSIDVSALPKEKFVTGKNGKPYYTFTVSISDEVNKYGQNVTAYEKKTPEEVEAKKATKYLGNGKTYYTDGKISVSTDCPERSEGNNSNYEKPAVKIDDLPF
jgi:hypothetical protein